MENTKKGLSGSILKEIAVVTMFIDHFSAIILTKILLSYINAPIGNEWIGSKEEYVIWYYVMQIMRGIGRIAFPIFCFLLVEGFERTRSPLRYMLRVGIFALLTELPFDLAFSADMIHGGYQNVMFTLLIGLVTMWGCSKMETHFREQNILLILGSMICVVAGMFLAELLHTDYSAKGVVCIMVLYFFRTNKQLQSIAGAASLLWEPLAMLAFLFTHQYNGKRGRSMKYFFYVFYPLHLLFLYAVSVIIGLGDIPVVPV